MAILQRDVRASDRDREQTVAQLKSHHAVGRLSHDELAWRAQAAYRAEGLRELARLTSDLPVPPRPPRRRRRPPYVALGVLCLLLAVWLTFVPMEITLAFVALVTALGMMAVFLLAPVWIPVLLAFAAYRLFRSLGAR
jgi:hypothetical protein